MHRTRNTVGLPDGTIQISPDFLENFARFRQINLTPLKTVFMQFLNDNIFLRCNISSKKVCEIFKKCSFLPKKVQFFFTLYYEKLNFSLEVKFCQISPKCHLAIGNICFFRQTLLISPDLRNLAKVSPHLATLVNTLVYD